ncbi:MAG: histidine phosphatase family protein [Nocardioidaceae bacterium]|nr:histidine phosphatase family protein [Nocardioidaceae bacterium]
MGVVLLVRHGQASFGAEDYDVLSETGWEQARTLGRWIAEHGPVLEAVVHGGMRRHRETWEGIAEGAGLDVVAEVDPDWAEFDHLAVLAHHTKLTGQVLDHGADRRAFQQHFEVATARWSEAGDDRADQNDRADQAYPEPYADFVTRARRALGAAAAKPGPTVVITSGGVIAALAAQLVLPQGAALGPVWGRFNTVIANTSITRVILGGGGARLLTFNEHPHLQRAQITYR